MLNKIIKELEEAKKYQIPHIEAGIEVAISIIKQHESEFEEEIKKAFVAGDERHLHDTPNAESYYTKITFNHE